MMERANFFIRVPSFLRRVETMSGIVPGRYLPGNPATGGNCIPRGKNFRSTSFISHEDTKITKGETHSGNYFFVALWRPVRRSLNDARRRGLPRWSRRGRAWSAG